MRLIDADALQDSLRYKKPEWSATEKYKQGYKAAILACRSMVHSAETVDPMKHGRWVTNGEDDGVVYCDQCLMPQDTWSNYCPSCGAIMDGGEHNGNSSDTLKTGQ